MIDFFTGEFWQQHSLWLMFASALLSATVLPGNSEIIFVALLTQLVFGQSSIWSYEVILLVAVAVSGNSLGSLTTYWLGRMLPNVQYKTQQHPYFQWAHRQFQRYGIWSLLLSWLPVVGDLFCVLAGWFSVNMWRAFFLMILGKLIRYVFLLYFTVNFLAISVK